MKSSVAKLSRALAGCVAAISRATLRAAGEVGAAIGRAPPVQLRARQQRVPIGGAALDQQTQRGEVPAENVDTPLVGSEAACQRCDRPGAGSDGGEKIELQRGQDGAGILVELGDVAEIIEGPDRVGTKSVWHAGSITSPVKPLSEVGGSVVSR